MSSLFPTLIEHQLVGALLVRLTLGIILVLWGIRGVKGKVNTKIVLLSVVDIIVGVLLIVGFLTQFATLVAAIILAVRLLHKAQNKALFTDGVNYYFILFIMAVSLMFTGAGAIAFDLPL